MRYNKGKCRVLYLGRNNRVPAAQPKRTALQKRLSARKGLGSSSAERDLGVLGDHKLTVTCYALRRAKAIPGCISTLRKSVANRCYDSLDVRVLCLN